MDLTIGTVALKSKVTADLIAEYLRDRILDGTFRPSTNINEAQLAAHLRLTTTLGF